MTNQQIAELLRKLADRIEASRAGGVRFNISASETEPVMVSVTSIVDRRGGTSRAPIWTAMEFDIQLKFADR